MPDVNSGVAVVGSDARAAIHEAYNGENMQRLAMQRESAYEALEASGRLKVATVLNFNPVQLKVEDGNVPWTVPTCTDTSAKRVSIDYDGRNYMASFLTVRKPAFNAWIRDVKKPADEGGYPTADYDPHFTLPIELVDQYNIEYNSEKRQNLMGGVICFEGDVHAFTKALKQKDTKDAVIYVPRSKTLKNRTLTYFTELVSVHELLKSSLDTQKGFCQDQLQRGDQFNQDENERKNITQVMRNWAQFSLDMGWKQIAPAWMSAVLDSEDSCKGCGKGKARGGNAFFCTCGRPYDAYAAFMAGEHVAESYLFALTGKQQQDVMAKLREREQMRALLRGEAVPEPAKPAKTDKPIEL